ncbi:ATP-binding protein, partial [Actinobacillus suis]
LKYSQASEIGISIIIEKDIRLSIYDNGIGFNPDEIMDGFGLKGMKERVEILDGKFKIVSNTIKNNDKQGTSIFITLPLI